MNELQVIENNHVMSVKGMTNDMKCQGFQYEIGEQYEIEPSTKLELCVTGFHAIPYSKNPLRVFSYYYPASEGIPNRFFSVSQFGKTIEDHSKLCSEKISIIGEISPKDLYVIHRQHAITKETQQDDEVCVAEHEGSALAGNYSVAIAGQYGSACVGSRGIAGVLDHSVAIGREFSTIAANDFCIAQGKNDSKIVAGINSCAYAENHSIVLVGAEGHASARDQSIACAGIDGTAITKKFGLSLAQHGGKAISTNFGISAAGLDAVAEAGEYGIAIGQYDCLAKAGENGIAISYGDSIVGNNGFAISRGAYPRAKGGLGSVIILIKEDERRNDIQSYQSFIINGIQFKPNVWYTIIENRVVEAESYICAKE